MSRATSARCPVDTLEFMHVAWAKFALNVGSAWDKGIAQLDGLSKDQLLIAASSIVILQLILIVSLLWRQKKLQTLTASLEEELSSTEKSLIRERLWRRAGGSNHTTISEVEIDDMLVSLGYVHDKSRVRREPS